jgi:hypothetical protein
MKELGEFSDLNIGLVLLDMENEGREVRVSNLTSNSVEIALVKDERWYDVECSCNKCGKKYRIINSDRSKKFVCSSMIEIEKEGKKFNVTCGGKAYTELKKEYTGVDCYQWFQYEKWFKERFKNK